MILFPFIVGFSFFVLGFCRERVLSGKAETALKTRHDFTIFWWCARPV
jgi:hypothetical protein